MQESNFYNLTKKGKEMSQKLSEEKAEQKNMIWALFFVTLILFGMNAFFPNEQKKAVSVSPTAQNAVSEEGGQVVAGQKILAQGAENQLTQQVQVQVPTIQRVAVQNDSVRGEYNVVTGGIDSLSLKKYKETVEPDSENVVLLSDDYKTASKWTSPDTTVPVPVLASPNEKMVLTTETPLILKGNNGVLNVDRKVEIDDKYLISTTDKITNLTNQPIRVVFNSDLTRRLEKEPATSAVHQGFVAVLKDKLIEEKYQDVQDEAFDEPTKGGWYGITDKYWQTAFVFDGRERGQVRFEKTGDKSYRASFEGEAITIPAGETYTHTSRIFAGAKEINLLTDYQNKYQIPKFELTIDFGWFYFLTKPFLYLLNWLYGLIGNMGVAILVFATLIRLALLPIATRSYESMARMRKVQPKMVELQKRFKDDRQRLQIEMMNLYKREKVNPMAGCLPLLLQIPVFYALYKVLSVAINMRQAPFFGWITDLSVPDPASVFTAFGYLDWPIPAIINIGVWPVLMGITMYIQQKLSPAPTDPTQAKVMKWLPIIFTFMLGGFAAGLVIYWTWSNLLSILQQKYIMRKVGVK